MYVMMCSGRVSNPGAIQFVECVNPVPNFVIAYITFGAMLLIAFPYIYLGRFHWVSIMYFLKLVHDTYVYIEILKLFHCEFVCLIGILRARVPSIGASKGES